jgi:hypothetical protein
MNIFPFHSVSQFIFWCAYVVTFGLGISIVLRDYVGHLCESLVPYPEVLNIR